MLLIHNNIYSVTRTDAQFLCNSWAS